MSSTTNRYNLQIFDWSTDTTRSFIDGLAGLTDSNMQKLEDVIGDIEDIVTSSIQLERVEISSGVDLNGLNDINKVYVSTNDTIARQCTNIPKSTINSFELRTYKTTYSQDSKYLMQILKTFTNELWIRGHDGYDNTWTEWKQMATNDDIETINNNIDDINTDINSSIDTINTNLTRATERIDTNANNIATNITNITNLTNKLTDYPTLEYLEEVKTDLENEIANIHIPTSLPASDVYDWAKEATKPTYTASEVGALASDGTAVNASKVEKALTLKIAGTTQNTYDGSTAQFFNIPNASTSSAGVMTTAMVTKLNGIATGANLIKTSKNTAKFSSQSAFSPIISSCIIGNNTVGGVWIFTGYISYNISSAPSVGDSILSINQQMTQCEDVTIVCPCMTANNAYITLSVKGGTLYYQSYTGSAPTSGSRYFVSAVIPVSSTSFLS